VMTLSVTERTLGYVVSALGTILASYWLLVILIDGYEGSFTYRAPSNGVCQAPYQFNRTTCQFWQVTRASSLWFLFGVVTLTAICLWWSARRRSVTGILVSSLVAIIALGWSKLSIALIILAAVVSWRTWRRLRSPAST